MYGHPDQYARHQIAQLQHSLFLSLEVLQIVLDRLEAKFGDDFFAGKARSALATQLESSAQESVNQLTELIQTGPQAAAVKAYREEFDLTWDEAHFGLSQWNILPAEQKVRLWRLNRWMKSVSRSAPEPL